MATSSFNGNMKAMISSFTVFALSFSLFFSLLVHQKCKFNPLFAFRENGGKEKISLNLSCLGNTER